MRSTMKSGLLGCALAVMTAGCAPGPRQPLGEATHHDRLYIRPNGEMLLNHTPVDADNVVIYPDGRGGERAAVKVRTKVHPPYFRDTIAVIREASDGQPAP